MFCVFLFSGVIHEAGISIPARGGYGLPMLYFLLQGCLLLIQNSQFGKRLELARGWRGRAFTLLTVFAPLALLFPPPFVYRVVVPMLQACGSL
jgi:alginate O-acetyltransferase complex protein AlgI